MQVRRRVWITASTSSAPIAGASVEQVSRRGLICGQVETPRRLEYGANMARVWLVLCIVAGTIFGGILGCTVSPAPTAVAAPVFAGSAIAATGARRAVSGGCWANCSKGWHCDEESGVCKRDEERKVREPTPPTDSVEPASVEPASVHECRAPLRCDAMPAQAPIRPSKEADHVPASEQSQQ